MSRELHAQRLKRIQDAVALREPDRVPCAPMYTTFPYLYAGYTMAEILYDIDKAKDSLRKYLGHFQPDMAYGIATVNAGMGPLFEKLGTKWMQWAGQPGSNIDKNSMHQYVEKPYLEENEYPEMLGDYTGWLMNKFLPRGFRALEPMRKIRLSGMRGSNVLPYAVQFSDPEVQEMFRLLGEVGAEAGKKFAETAAFDSEIEELGFPVQMATVVTTAFDQLSDSLRGTLDTMVDLYSQPEHVIAAVEKFFPDSLQTAIAAAKASPSTTKMVYIPLHKGMDGFLTHEQYRTFYWDTLLRLINGLVDAGLVPWVYCEGPYDSRVECLMDVPKGKTYIHFEEADMRRVKKLLGDRACVSGGISSYMLRWESKDAVINKVKENLDILAPGGGFIFDLGDTIDEANIENVEAMFETVKTYGKY